MVAERNNGNKLRILIVHNYYQIPGRKILWSPMKRNYLKITGTKVTLYTARMTN